MKIRWKKLIISFCFRRCWAYGENCDYNLQFISCAINSEFSLLTFGEGEGQKMYTIHFYLKMVIFRLLDCMVLRKTENKNRLFAILHHFHAYAKSAKSSSPSILLHRVLYGIGVAFLCRRIVFPSFNFIYSLYIGK